MSSPVFVPAHARLPLGRLAAAVRGVVFGFLPPAAWLAALLLVGCSAPLPYQARDAGLPEARAAFQNRRLQGQDLAAFLAAAGERLPAAGEGWQFDALALAAGWYSADVAQAQVRWEAALERRREGWSRPALPFEAFVEHHSVTDLARPQPWTLGLGFELTLPSERRRLAREAQLDSAVALARIELARAFWAARERVRAPWLDQQLLQARLPLAVQQLTLCEQREQRSGRRQSTGEADAGELHAAQRARQQAQAQVEGVKRELAAAQARLRVALALPPDAGEVVLAPLAEGAAASAEGRSERKKKKK